MKSIYVRLQKYVTLISAFILGFLVANSSLADEVHAINAIVEGHLCVSDSDQCTDPETYPSGLVFNADIKIEDDFLSIYFNDTTANETDWQIQVDYDFTGTPPEAFSIGHNIEGSLTGDENPFVIETGTATNLLYLDSQERIGINTNAPAYTVDAVGNRIRLTNGPRSVQLRADGAATDVEAIGADLFLRSSTDGENIVMNPFQFDGNVGIGTTSPTAKLHVATSDGNGQVLVQEQNATVTRREVFRVENNGDPSFVFQDTSSGNGTEFRLFAGVDDFVINHLGTGGPDLALDRSGNLDITGSLSQGSSISSKTAIVTVLSEEVLQKVLALPISSWQYKKDEPGVRHLGPMAEEFHAAFGLGEDDTSIAPADLAGVALSAIQAQQLQIEQQRQELSEKDGQIADLQTRLAAIEKRLSE